MRQCVGVRDLGDTVFQRSEIQSVPEELGVGVAVPGSLTVLVGLPGQDLTRVTLRLKDSHPGLGQISASDGPPRSPLHGGLRKSGMLSKHPLPSKSPEPLGSHATNSKALVWPQ